MGARQLFGGSGCIAARRRVFYASSAKTERVGSIRKPKRCSFVPLDLGPCLNDSLAFFAHDDACAGSSRARDPERSPIAHCHCFGSRRSHHSRAECARKTLAASLSVLRAHARLACRARRKREREIQPPLKREGRLAATQLGAADAAAAVKHNGCGLNARTIRET